MRKLIFVCSTALLLISCNQNNENLSASESQTAEAVYHQASIFPKQTKNTAENKTYEAEQQNVWLKSLITETPQEGRELAIKMARQTIGAVQKDPEVKKRLREKYSEDYAQLINISKVVAIEFQTIAEANNYWKE